MSATSLQTRPSLLSAAAEAVVRATAAVVAEHAEQITARFYPRMFAEYPELLRVFNQGNQATGEQSQALAGAVVAYAVQLIDPNAPSFEHVMKRIAYKHVSLGIRPEQYTIVGAHLLAAVGEVLGDAVTPEIAAAWNEVYWLFAAQLIAEEARLYQQAGVDPAHPLRPYAVVRRIDETADVISLVLEPADGGDLPEIRPGQYVSVFVDLPDGDRQPRQYTVSSTAFGTRLQITVRRVRGVNGAPTAGSPRTCTIRSPPATGSRSAPRPAISSSNRRTDRCCWPARAPESPLCCRSSSTSPGPSRTARSSSRTPTAPRRITRCARPC